MQSEKIWVILHQLFCSSQFSLPASALSHVCLSMLAALGCEHVAVPLGVCCCCLCSCICLAWVRTEKVTVAAKVIAASLPSCSLSHMATMETVGCLAQESCLFCSELGVSSPVRARRPRLPWSSCSARRLQSRRSPLFPPRWTCSELASVCVGACELLRPRLAGFGSALPLARCRWLSGGTFVLLCTSSTQL
jgi:hypothetical protein